MQVFGQQFTFKGLNHAKFCTLISSVLALQTHSKCKNHSEYPLAMFMILILVGLSFVLGTHDLLQFLFPGD